MKSVGNRYAVIGHDSAVNYIVGNFRIIHRVVNRGERNGRLEWLANDHPESHRLEDNQ
jgi:hypothetical protein